MIAFHNLLTKHACLRHVMCALGYLVLIAFYIFATSLTSIYCVHRFNFDLILTYEAVSLIWAVILCVLLKGASIFRSTKEQLHIAWKIYKPMIVIAFLNALLSVPLLFQSLPAPNVFHSVLYQIILCVYVGFSEEVLFRGVIFHGCLKIFSSCRHKLLLSCIVVALIFGAFHIAWNKIDVHDEIQLAQIMGKILQTGLCSVLFCLAVYKTKSIIGVSLLHALDDLILMIIPFGILGHPVSTDYVVKGADGISLAIFYAVLVLVYVYPIIRGIKLFKTLPEVTILPRQQKFYE